MTSIASHPQRLASALALVALLLSACADDRDVTAPPPPRSSSTTDPESEPTEPTTVDNVPATTPSTNTTNTTTGSPTEPTFTPGPCPVDTTALLVDVECGTIGIDQDRSDPSDGVVTLAVMVVRSGDGAQLAPVVFLPGGPGDSAVSTIADLATDADAIGVFGGRDWIVFDPRGTGFSTPTVACPVTDEMTDTQRVDAASECATRLRADGVDLTTYNTSELAADAIDVRTALGIDRWNILGISYGTRVALELMRHDVDAIDAAVLDGVYPPTQGFNDSLDERPTAAFEQLFADCLDQAPCATAFPDLEPRVIDMIERLNASPVKASGFTITGDFAVVVAARAMYHYTPGQDEISTIPLALSMAADGDLTALVRLAQLNFSDEPGSAGDALADTTLGMGQAVHCHDEIPFLDRELADEQAVYSPFGAAFARLEGNVEFDICPVFGAGVADPAFRQPVAADVATLMLTGTYDPTTPTRWADEAAATLTRAQVARFPGVGHVVINTGACPITLIHAFLDDPGGPLDLACVEDYTPPDFAI